MDFPEVEKLRLRANLLDEWVIVQMILFIKQEVDPATIQRLLSKVRYKWPDENDSLCDDNPATFSAFRASSPKPVQYTSQTMRNLDSWIFL